jgi:DNA-binding NtrC family response regulator
MFKAFKHKPQVILMDHHLPKKNGIEASKEILQIDPKIKIIFITGDKLIEGEAFACGAFSFLEKPLTIKLLIKIIKKAIKNYNLHKYISQ